MNEINTTLAATKELCTNVAILFCEYILVLGGSGLLVTLALLLPVIH